MSRIGKKIIVLPSGVTVSRDGSFFVARSQSGLEMRVFIPEYIDFLVSGQEISVTCTGFGLKERSLYGLTRTLISNAVEGVSRGFSQSLEINGVGYRAELSGRILSLSVGFSHVVSLSIPDGLSVRTEKGKSSVESGQDAVFVVVSGSDKNMVGQFCSKIRLTKPPEPYKGKGIKRVGEVIVRKEGKTGSK